MSSGIERSRALHQAVAKKIATDPNIICRARERCMLWMEQGKLHRHYGERWLQILNSSSDALCLFLTDAPEFEQLAGTSPFVGVLSPQERWGILRELRGAP